MKSLWLFCCELSGEFLVRTVHFPSNSSVITLRDPIANRNEIFCLEHATSYERALEWISWLKDENNERHAELDSELKPSDLAHVVPVEFRIETEAGIQS